MLETSQERVRLLKAGIYGNTIEKLYIIFNNYKIDHTPLHFELVEINAEENKDSAISQEEKSRGRIPTYFEGLMYSTP